MSRKHGQLNFHLTQVLSGHGCFDQYLFKMRIKEDPQCSHCSNGQNDGPQHTLCECVAWGSERDKLVTSLALIGVHEPIVPENLVSIMLTSKEAWDLASGFACTVMKKKWKWNGPDRERKYRHSKLLKRSSRVHSYEEKFARGALSVVRVRACA